MAPQLQSGEVLHPQWSACRNASIRASR
jgi:hypothetical protein